MALAAFLPLDDASGQFGGVRENTLIQHGGWMLIIGALVIAAAGFRAVQRKGKYWLWPAALCAFGALRIIGWAADKDLRTLYPVTADGSLDTSRPGTVVPLGIAIYVAGAGIALAFIGSLLLNQTGEPPAPNATAPQKRNKKCPDCAETILYDAKVCKHCNYRFATTNVRCHKCQHRWPVLADLTKFECENCGEMLRRKAGAQGG
jgi:predicted RNA-binding Zn-ribbon protein involved in translation (DUF1610 family)